MQESLARIPNVPFSLADKKTLFSEKKHDYRDIKLKDNSASFMHLLAHRIGPKAGSGQAEFETGLRGYNKDSQREKGWWYIPKKDRHDFPEFPKPYKE